MKTIRLLALLALAQCCGAVGYADVFGSGEHSFEIEFVTVGDPGNPDDKTGNPSRSGAVDQTFRIGKYEIAEGTIDKANALGGLGLTHNDWGANKPATDLTWFEAAKFVNWLNVSTNNPVAYKFDEEGVFQVWTTSDTGYDPENIYRNSQAKYFLPSVDEWYKAAYYDPVQEVYYDYPTGSDTRPDGVDFAGDPDFDAVYFGGVPFPGPFEINDVGHLSPYGTAGQGGNVLEWIETDKDLQNGSSATSDHNDRRGLRGGTWGTRWTDMLSTSWGGIEPINSDYKIGFRVASIPEPTSMMLGILAVLGLLINRKL